ncbi:hypothetical protein, partial [Oceanispirochaeta sp.]|uniref:hypothetical protein n=1 Tax=Oceanispirochaeta sp. TaxID=2035350 RepID=UPI002636FF13
VYFSLNWSPLGVYVFSFFNKDGFIIYPLIVLLFFAFRKKSYNGIPLRELTAWFCGYYFMFALSESIVMRGAMIPYDAILNPLLRLFQLLLFSVLLVRYLHETRPNFKLFYILTYFLLPWILNFLPTLNLLNYSFLFYILFLLTGAASLSLYLMESRGNIS